MSDCFETQEAFDALLDDLTSQFNPRDLFETLCVRRIANCFWRLDRALRFECKAIESARASDASNPLADFARKMLGTPRPRPQPSRPARPRRGAVADPLRVHDRP